ncbi:MAG: hypothetical protein PHI50_03895 [Alphaproteobacteria bacterium]|nr:hypothetical protein [Alphaproteobacteria bacterium]
MKTNEKTNKWIKQKGFLISAPCGLVWKAKQKDAALLKKLVSKGQNE